jgi:hypothetical protein
LETGNNLLNINLFRGVSLFKVLLKLGGFNFKDIMKAMREENNVNAE